MNDFQGCKVVVLVVAGLFAGLAQAQYSSQTSQSKIVKLLAMAQGAGSNPTELYKKNPSDSTVGHDFALPAPLGTLATATTLYTRDPRDTRLQVWHVALSFNPQQLGNVKPLRQAYPALAQALGDQALLQELVLVVSEGDGTLNYGAVDTRSVLFRSGGPLAVNKPLRGNASQLKLKKGVNVFAVVNRVNKPVLNALERIALSGGEPTGQTVLLRGQVGYDVIGELLGRGNVDAAEAKAVIDEEKSQRDAKGQPIPFSIGITYPRVIPAPFNVIANKADAKNLLYTELASTSLDLAINRFDKTVAIASKQVTDAWILGSQIQYTGVLDIKQTANAASKTYEVKGSGGLDLRANPLGLGLPDFFLTGVGPATQATFTVPASGKGKVEKTSQEGEDTDPSDSLSFALGASVQYGKSRKTTGGLISVGLDNGSGSPRLRDFVIGLQNGIELRELEGLNSVEALARVNVENLYLAMTLPSTGGRPNFALAGGVKVSKTPAAQGLSGRVGIMAHDKNFFLLLRGDQTSAYAIADTFAGSGDLLPRGSAERNVLASIVLPQVVLALGTGPAGTALIKKDLPKPIQDMLGAVVAGSETKIPISTRGVTAIGKIDFNALDPSVKDALNAMGIDLRGDFLAAISAEGFKPDTLKMGVNFQLPTLTIQSGNQQAGNLLTAGSGTGNLFLRVDMPAKAMQLGIGGQMGLKMPGQSQPVNMVGDLYVNLQKAGAGVFFSGYTQGDWVAPLGIQGMTFRNGAVLIGIDSTGALEFGTGVKVAFDGINQRQAALGGAAEAQFRQAELQRLSDGGAASPGTNEITTGLYFAANLSTGVPTPKKLGFVYESDRMGFVEALRISDTLIKGLVSGPMKNDLINAQWAANNTQVANAMTQGKSVNDVILNAVDSLPIPLGDLEFRETKLFFATPGAQLPGFDALSGEMGVSIETDVWIRNRNKAWEKVQASGTTRKFIIKVTPSGVDFGGLAEVIENAYYQVASVTVEALSAELNCPVGSTYNTLDGACLKCPTGYGLTGLPANDPGACLKIQPEYRSARFLKKGNTPFNCPTDSVFDPRNEGECWSCPNGYIRNTKAVTDGSACTELPKASFASANKHGKGTGWFGTDCKSGQFWHAKTGYCYTCPSGYISTAFGHPDGGKACAAVKVDLKTAKATKVRSGKPDDRGAFMDVGKLEFWTCQNGGDSRTWNRTLQPVTASNACKFTTVAKAKASTVPRGQIKSLDNLCLTAQGGNDAIRDNEPVVLKTCASNSARAQSWFKDSLGRIRPLQQLSFEEGKTGALCLEAITRNNTVEMQLQLCNLNATQKWLADGFNRIVNDDRKGCMVRTGGVGSAIRLANCADNVNNQRWAFDNQPLTRVTEYAEPVEYTGTLRAATEGCLEAGEGANNKSESFTRCIGKQTQVWRMDLDGYIENAATGRCLDIAGINKADNAAVQLWECVRRDDVPQQRWRFDGSRRLHSKLHDKCLALHNGALRMEPCNTSDDQRWGFNQLGENFKPFEYIKPPVITETSVSWKRVPGTIKDIEVSDNGLKWALGTNNALYFRWSTDGDWTRINPPEQAVSVAAVGESGLAIASTNGNIWYHPFYGEQGQWEQKPGKASKVFGGPGGELWHLSERRVGPGGYAMYRWNGSGWSQVGGEAAELAIAGNGVVWHISESGRMYKSTNNGANWQRVGGQAADIDISRDGQTVWHTTWAEVKPGVSAIYGSNDGGNTWKAFQGTAQRLALTHNGEPWHVGGGGSVWAAEKLGYQPPPPAAWQQAGEWERMPGSLSAVEIAPSGEVWGLGKAGEIYVFGSGRWNRVAGTGVQIAHGRDGKTWHLNSIGNMYVGDKSGRWSQVPGKASSIAGSGTPGAFGGSVWHLSNVKTPQGGYNGYKLMPSGSWTKVNGLPANTVQVALSANAGMAMGSDGQLRYVSSDGVAVSPNTMNGVRASSIAMAADGKTAWHLSKDLAGEGGYAIYRSTDVTPGGGPKTWQKVPGELVQIAAHPSSGKAWGVSKQGHVYRLK